MHFHRGDADRKPHCAGGVSGEYVTQEMDAEVQTAQSHGEDQARERKGDKRPLPEMSRKEDEEVTRHAIAHERAEGVSARKAEAASVQKNGGVKRTRTMDHK